MSISRLCSCITFKLVCFCTTFKLVCACTTFKLVCSCTTFKLVCSTCCHDHRSRFPGYDHYHSLSYLYVSTLLTLPKSRSSN
jgi:hypothetical protein